MHFVFNLFYYCKKTPIIQGVADSGKSFIIKPLSEILEQDLSIYLLNSNSGLSLFTGQSVMKEEFDIIKKEKLKKILKIKDKNVEDINSENFSQFLVKINKKLKPDELKESEN